MWSTISAYKPFICHLYENWHHHEVRLYSLAPTSQASECDWHNRNLRKCINLIMRILNYMFTYKSCTWHHTSTTATESLVLKRQPTFWWCISVHAVNSVTSCMSFYFWTMQWHTTRSKDWSYGTVVSESYLVRLLLHAIQSCAEDR